MIAQNTTLLHRGPLSQTSRSTAGSSPCCSSPFTPIARHHRRHLVSFASPSEEAGSAAEKGVAWPKVAAVGGVLASVAVVSFTQDTSSLLEAIKEASSDEFLGPAVFIGAYALATVFLFPASLLTLAAGALYGPIRGTAIVSLASTLGATLAFLVSRLLAREWVEAKLKDSPKLNSILNGVISAKVVFLLRLSPLLPFNLLNYGLGLTSISLVEYVIASWAGMLPGTVAYVSLGGVGGQAAAQAQSGSFDLVKIGLYALGALATLAVAKITADIATNEIKQEAD